MKRKFLIIAGFLLFYFNVNAGEIFNFQKIKSTPDLVQTCKEANFSKNGSFYCAPVAVSNSLVWLSKNNLIPLKLTDRFDQYNLVKKLAKDKYFRTDTHKGTGVNSLTKGLDKYLNSIGVKNYKISHSGWRVCKDKYNNDNQLDIKWINENISGNQVQWLNIGWYRENNGKMYRFGGHWLTVVDYYKRKCYVLDPAPRNGIKKKTHLLTIGLSPEYKLRGKTKGLPSTSKGMLKIEKGFNFKDGTDLCLIDSSVSLLIN